MVRGRRAEKRRAYFVKKEFQVKFILQFCLLLFLGIVISTGLLYVFSQGTLTTSFQQSRLVIQNTGLAILPSVIITNLITFALITIAAMIVTLFVSHKIAGPLLRFEKEIKIIGEGDLTREIKLRGSDQVTEIGESLSTMVGDLHEKVVDIKNRTEHLCQTALDQNVPQEIRDQLDQLCQKIENGFKV